MKLVRFCFLLCVWVSAFSQSLQNAIQGEVTDSTGAAIAGATVSVTNTATDIVRTVIPRIRPGSILLPRWSLENMRPRDFAGMKPVVQTGIIVQADKAVRVDFRSGCWRSSRSPWK